MSHGRLIHFTRAADEGQEEGDERRFPRPGGSLDGEQAKSFYEGLLASSGQAASRPRPRPNPVRQRSDVRRRARGFAEHASYSEGNGGQAEGAQRRGHLLLKAAQHGDLRTLRRLLEKGACDINFRDGFYWTATMCAAHSGQSEAVGYLLDNGAAWIGVCDTAGRDALDLARQAGHAAVAALLEGYRGCRNRPGGREDRRARPPQKKFCEACRLEYQEDTAEQHERSTLHLLSTSDKLPPTHYFIPESNVGFQMLLKGGWDQETGLGPDGKGRKFPVRTVLKRDQKGLGFQTDLRPKVTHFNARDPEAVQPPRSVVGRAPRAATVSRREERRREARQKAWERDLRMHMNF
ncbi:G patch domain and ankyrin repeat-containing protein 1 [Mobula birostris]|uniref:G patch domain and ankyrin repeat-containing protein 1 n=1 Tax=Mobula birostris TaxID=1983395 RepID=UPI003B27F78E